MSDQELETHDEEHTPDIEQEAPQSSGIEVPGEAQPDVEERARAQGWRPQDEFRGNPEDWRSAEEFLERGEQEMPILRERNRHLTDQIAQLERKQQEYDATIARMDHMSRLALQRQREQLQANFHAAKRQAVEFGDTDQFDQLSQQEYETLSRFDQDISQVTQPPQPQQPQQPQIRPEEREFIQRNPWYQTDPEMHHMANNVSAAIGMANPDMSLSEVIKQTETKIKALYPEKFGSAAMRPQMAAVEGGASTGRGAVSRSTGRGAGSLPPDARKQGQAFVEEGLYKSLDEYAKEYFALEA